MQAALDIPMTVYGTGGQTRGFIHVTDTAKCLEAAVVNPPPSNGPVEIFNQASHHNRPRERLCGSAARTPEACYAQGIVQTGAATLESKAAILQFVHRADCAPPPTFTNTRFVRFQVAETHRVRDLAQMIADKTGTKIDFISNPRNEAAENELEVKNEKFGNLGVDFKSLDATLLEEVSGRDGLGHWSVHKGLDDSLRLLFCSRFPCFVPCVCSNIFGSLCLTL